MSYGTKYKVGWWSYFDEDCELLIEEEDYGGASTTVNGAGDPLTIAWETPTDFILDPVNGSMATFRIMAETDFQFLNLYTANNRKYRITFNVDSALKWRGFLSPDMYQEEYKAPPYVNEFVATDQLGYLKTLAWDQGSAMTLLDALEYIMDKTDLELDLWEALNVYHYGFDMTEADSPLDQTWFNGDAYDGMTYYDALKDILVKFGAVIRQDLGKWFIFRPSEVTASAHTASPEFVRRLWTWSSGTYTYDSYASYNPTVATTSAIVAKASLVRLAPSSMWINPAWARYKIIRDYVKRASLLDNHDFTEWSGTLPTYWSASTGAGALTQRQGNKMRIISTTDALAPLRYWYQQKNCTADIYGLSVRYNVFVSPGNSLTVYFGLLKMTTNRYWDFDTNQWSTSPKVYTRTFDNSGGSVAINEEVTANIFTSDSVTGTTSIIFSMYAPYGNPTAGTDYVEFDEIGLRVLDEVSAVEIKEYPASAEYDIEVNPDNNSGGPDITLYVCDYPEVDWNIRHVHDGVLFTNSGLTSQTEDWTETGSGPYHYLREILWDKISDLHREPQQVLNGKIYSKLLYPTSVIKETSNSDKLYLIKRAEWDPKNGTWDIEAHEIVDIIEDYLLQETGDKILQETGDGILI